MEILIEVPESERDQFITALKELAAASNAYAEECIAILVEKHGGTRTPGGMEVFHCIASGRIARGEPLPTPDAAVEKAIRIWRPDYLGLPTSYAGLSAAAWLSEQRKS